MGEARRVIQSTVAKRKEEATEGSARAPLLASTVVGVASCKGGWGRVVALAGRQDGGDGGGGGSGAGPGGLACSLADTDASHSLAELHRRLTGCCRCCWWWRCVLPGPPAPPPPTSLTWTRFHIDSCNPALSSHYHLFWNDLTPSLVIADA